MTSETVTHDLLSFFSRAIKISSMIKSGANADEEEKYNLYQQIWTN